MDKFAAKEKRVDFALITITRRNDLLKGIIDACDVNKSEAAAGQIREIRCDQGDRSLDKWLKNLYDASCKRDPSLPERSAEAPSSSKDDMAGSGGRANANGVAKKKGSGSRTGEDATTEGFGHRETLKINPLQLEVVNAAVSDKEIIHCRINRTFSAAVIARMKPTEPLKAKLESRPEKLTPILEQIQELRIAISRRCDFRADVYLRALMLPNGPAAKVIEARGIVIPDVWIDYAREHRMGIYAPTGAPGQGSS